MSKGHARGDAAFTMIEMIVVVGVMTLLSSVALTTYLNFRDRKQAVADARLVTDHLRTVRVKATAVEVPLSGGSPIPGITNYTVVLSSSAINTNVNFLLHSAVVNYLPQINFTNGTTLTSITLVFSAGNGGIGSGAVINVCGLNRYKYTINVSAQGIVSDPVSAGACP